MLENEMKLLVLTAKVSSFPSAKSPEASACAKRADNIRGYFRLLWAYNQYSQLFAALIIHLRRKGCRIAGTVSADPFLRIHPRAKPRK